MRDEREERYDIYIHIYIYRERERGGDERETYERGEDMTNIRWKRERERDGEEYYVRERERERERWGRKMCETKKDMREKKNIKEKCKGRNIWKRGERRKIWHIYRER